MSPLPSTDETTDHDKDPKKHPTMSALPPVCRVMKLLLERKEGINFSDPTVAKLVRVTIRAKSHFDKYQRLTKEDKVRRHYINALLERYEKTAFFDYKEAMELARSKTDGGLLVENFEEDSKDHKGRGVASESSIHKVLAHNGSALYVRRMAADPRHLAVLLTMGGTRKNLCTAFGARVYHGCQNIFDFCQQFVNPPKSVRRSPAGTAFLKLKVTKSCARTTITSHTTSTLSYCQRSRHVVLASMSPLLPCRRCFHVALASMSP